MMFAISRLQESDCSLIARTAPKFQKQSIVFHRRGIRRLPSGCLDGVASCWVSFNAFLLSLHSVSVAIDLSFYLARLLRHQLVLTRSVQDPLLNQVYDLDLLYMPDTST